MSQPKPSMWDFIMTTYTEVTEAGEEAYLVKAKSTFACLSLQYLSDCFRLQLYPGGE